MLKGRTYTRLMVPMYERSVYDRELMAIRAKERLIANEEFAKRQMERIEDPNKVIERVALRGEGVKLG